MPVEIYSGGCGGEGPNRTTSRHHEASFSDPERAAEAITIGLINNMPDAAFKATERQYRSPLGEASGEDIKVRLPCTVVCRRFDRAIPHIKLKLLCSANRNWSWGFYNWKQWFCYLTLICDQLHYQDWSHRNRQRVGFSLGFSDRHYAAIYDSRKFFKRRQWVDKNWTDYKHIPDGAPDNHVVHLGASILAPMMDI